jgi:hypothetical protein
VPSSIPSGEGLLLVATGCNCTTDFYFVSVVFFPSRSEEDDDIEEDDSLSHGGRQNHENLYRVHMPSLYSCGSSYGSETSIPAAAHTVSNAPVTEYM